MASRSKSKTKKHAGSSQKTSGFGKKGFNSELQRAIGFLRRGKFEKAHEVLTELDQTYPDRSEVLVELANCYAAVTNLSRYQETCERLLELDPKQSVFTLGLATSYLAAGAPMLALKTFRSFAERWPNHAGIGEVRESITELEAELADCLADIGLPNTAEGFETAARHEQVQRYLERNEFQSALTAGKALLETHPELAAVRNNMSLAYFYEGDFENAIAQARQVLDIQSNNIHALGNLVRYLYITGEVDEVKAVLPRLLESDAQASDPWTKKMETLSYLGDWDGVIELYDQAQASGDIRESATYNLFFHLGAVAMARLGRIGEARKIWQRIVKRSPSFRLAENNLADSNQALGQRHGAWPIGFSQWLGLNVMQDIHTTVSEQFLSMDESQQTDEESDAKMHDIFSDVLERYPYLNHLIPIWFERGGPQTRQLAWFVTSYVKAPEHLEAMKAFALGQWGTDDLRYQAAMEAVKGKVLDKQNVRMYLQGEWREINLIAYEFHEDRETSHSDEVQELLGRALDGLREVQHAPENADMSELHQEIDAQLKKALEYEPDAPDLRQNLAVSYEQQGRKDESIALIDSIIEDHPEYVHALASRAKAYLVEDNVDKARDLLLPLLSRDRFHFEDFAEFSDVYLEFLVAQGQEDGAKSWLQMWEEVDPEHPKIMRWKIRWMDREQLMERMRSLA